MRCEKKKKQKKTNTLLDLFLLPTGVGIVNYEGVFLGSIVLEFWLTLGFFGITFGRR